MEFVFDDDPVFEEELYITQTADEENLDLIFINVFEQCHSLYDKKSPAFKDRHSKESDWVKIASTMGSSVPDAIKKWNRLRRRFTSERRQLKAPPKSGSAYRPHQVWPLYSAMSFMEPHVTPRTTQANTIRVTPKATVSESQNFTQIGQSLPSSSTIYVPQSLPLQFSSSYPLASTSKHILSFEKTLSSAQSQPTLISASHSSASLPTLQAAQSFQEIRIPTVTHPVPGMIRPDAFHANKKAKMEGIDMYFRASIDSVNKNLNLLAQRSNTSSSGSSTCISTGHRHFANYLCEMFEQISSKKKKRECHQKLISVISEFISDDEEL